MAPIASGELAYSRPATARAGSSATSTRRARVQAAAANGSASHSRSFSASSALPKVRVERTPSRAMAGEAGSLDPSPPGWNTDRYSARSDWAVDGHRAREPPARPGAISTERSDTAMSTANAATMKPTGWRASTRPTEAPTLGVSSSSLKVGRATCSPASP